MILLVEDEPGLQLTLSDRLRREGYEVDTAADGQSGLERAAAEAFDLVLLDVMLPRKNGFDVLRDLRQRGTRNAGHHAHRAWPGRGHSRRPEARRRRLPLQAVRDDGAARADRGAATAHRRRRRTPRRAISSARCAWTFGSAEVSRGTEPIELSAREFQLLRYLIEHRNEVISRDQLLNEVWGYNAMPSTRTVDVHVAWLRQKIEPNPRHPQFLLTVHGLGYRFAG